MKYLNTILNVPTTDPDDARRRRLLNILLLGTLIAAMIGLVSIVINIILNPEVSQSETQILLVGITVFTLGIFGIYLVNRRFSGRLAASLFLFTIPIAMSSLILLPQASFLFAAISSGIVAWLAFTIDHSVNLFGPIG